MVFSFSPVLKHSAAILAVVALAGCASLARTPEAMVSARAAQYWKAKVANDLDATYALTSPSYRAATSLDSYKKGFGSAVQLKSAAVDSVKCETEDKCVSLVKVEALPLVTLGRRNLPPLVTFIDETWIREGDQWWLFPTP